MEKTTVYLTTEQRAALARTAAAEGRSEAHLVRAGIDAVIARHRAAEAPHALAPGTSEHGPQEPSLDRPRWIDRDVFVGVILRLPADGGLRAELRELAPGTTDDEPIP